MPKKIFLDLNTRLSIIEPEDTMVVSDAQAIKQSLWRLFNTKEGEIPYFRGYGIDVEQFCQQPKNQDTAQEINEYILGKVNLYEPRAGLAKSPDVLANVDTGYLSFVYHFYVKATGEIIDLPVLNVYLGK